jgi:mono/diheme cytochrome c family protein/plastocyanin
MTDEPGREGGQERLPVPQPPAEPPDAAARFTSPPQARRFELTPARAAAIVTASASARWVGFLATVVIILFVIVYYFYELAPEGLSTSRLDAEMSAQAVTAVERGYNVYQANCARCHGVDGEGGIGPVLNDQVKLFWHLTPEYLATILTVGGRYACGNPDSIMPIWSDQGSPPGPLNYRQVQELIEFIRAPDNEEFVVRNAELFTPEEDPETGQVLTFRGWRDPLYTPAPGATPFPDCWSGQGPSPSTQPLPPVGSTTVSIVAENIAFTPLEIRAPAGEVWAIDFDQRDSGVGGHDVDIINEQDQKLADNPVLTDPGTTTYTIPALSAGTYTFQCSVHPIPAMTGTLIVE